MNLRNFLPRLLHKIGLLPFLNVYSTLYLSKQKFIIPIINKVGYEHLFISETWMLEVLKYFKEEIEIGTFVDVGANTGQTLLKVKSVLKGIRYIGFEPNPTCAAYVKQLICSNPKTLFSSEIIPVAIYTRSVLLPLYFFHPSETDTTASIISEFRKEDKISKRDFIPSFNYREIEEGLSVSDISCLKIDVEGAELEVLKSFEHVIKKNRPIVFLEILPVYSEDNIFRHERQIAIENFFTEEHYQLFRIKIAKGKFSTIEKIENNTIGIHSNLNFCEYISLPLEKTKSESIL